MISLLICGDGGGGNLGDTGLTTSDSNKMQIYDAKIQKSKSWSQFWVDCMNIKLDLNTFDKS